MKGKKDLGRVLLSVVIATIMISIPPTIIATNGSNGGNGNNVHEISGAEITYGESGTPPYPPGSYGRHEDNRHIAATGWYDPYRYQGRRLPDVDVTYLNIPDPTRPHDTSETDVVATVTNWDNEEHWARIYLQVYKEVEFDPVVIWQDDMESCCVNWTTLDADEDGNTWARTTERANSPTHSWHNVQDCVGGTYVANSDDWLISREIEIPEMCSGERPTLVWIDFMQWLQGEVSGDTGKFEDYGEIYYRIDGGDWVALAAYADTNGEWLTSDPDNTSVTALVYPGAVYDYDRDNNPLGFRIPFTANNHTIQIAFRWVSDPGTQYEGWYIDDVVVRAQCGGLQELVWQEYKPVDEGLYLAPFNETGFQKEVKFKLPFTPENDTTYFFEVYSEICDLPPYEETVDVDGHYDWVGDNTTTFPSGIPDPDKPEGWFIDPMTGASYWNPRNGVNESIYFGIWHDAAAIDINWDGVTQEIEKNGCVDIPITGHVSNEGTVAEQIPYTIEVRKTAVDYIVNEDFEAGNTSYYLDQGYEIGYFENPNCVLPHVATNMDAHSGTNAWYFGAEVCPDQNEGYYGSNMYCAFRTPWIDVSEYVGRVTTHFTYWVNYNINDKLGPSPGYQGAFDPGWADKWYFGVITPDGVYLFLSSTATSGSSHGWIQVESTNTPALEAAWNAAHPDDPWYPIEITNPEGTSPVSWLKSIGYGDGKHIAFFWAMATDDTDNTYEGEPWSGLYVDDMVLYSSGTGEVIWSMDGVTDVLEPGEQAEVHATWHACNYSDYTPVITTHLEGDWNTKFKGHPTLGYMYNDEAMGNNLYIYTTVYDEDFEPNLYTEAGEFTSEWSTHDNTFGESAYWTIVSNDAPGWQENHYVWTGEAESGDSNYPASVDEVLVPKDPETGEILTFDMTGQTAVTLEFDLWNEIESGWEGLYVEVSNDSGNNWFTVAEYDKVSNRSINMEGDWEHKIITLFNGTDYIVAYDSISSTAFSFGAYAAWNDYMFPDWWTMYDVWDLERIAGVPHGTWWPGDPEDYGAAIGMTQVGITENMTFRFHFISDDNTQYKGAYIDNVELACLTNETIPWDGTEHPWRWTKTVLFEDDFENGLDKWFNINDWTGSMWHVTDTCHYSGDYSAANFDPYPWSSYHLLGDGLYWAYVTTTITGYIDEAPWMTWYFENIAGMDPVNASDNGTYYGQYWDPLGNPVLYYFWVHDYSYGYYRNEADDKLILDVDLSGVYQAWLRYMINYTLDAGDYLAVEISTDGGNTWKELIRYTPDDATNGAGWVHQTSSPSMGYEPYNYGIDITPYVGQEAKIRWKLVSNETMNNGAIQLDDVWITGKIDNEAPTTVAILDPATPDGCNGWYVSPVTVTLVADDNIEVDATYYSIDGGSWLKYTAPFTINVDGEHTISYYSVDSVGNVETAGSVSFKIDTTAPTASITFPEAGYIYLMGRQLFKNPFGGTFIIGKMTFQADADDATSGVKNVHFTIGDNEYDDTSSPYEVFWHNFDWLPTKYTVTVTATDNACNTGASDSLDFTHWL